MDTIVDVTEAGFESVVLHSPLPVLVDFWAPWCGPCRALEPIFEDAAESLAGLARFARVNVDNNSAIAERYEVKGIPQLILFRKGQAVDKVVGFATKESIISMVRTSRDAGALHDLSDADFEERVTRSAKPVMVVFGSSSAGIYRALLQVVQKVSETSANNITFFSATRQNAPEAFARLNIAHSGLVLVFRNGEVIDRMEGYLPEETVISMLSSVNKVSRLPEVMGTEFGEQVLQSAVPVVVEACDGTSGLFRRAAQIIEEKFSGRIRYFKINIEQNPELVHLYNLSAGELLVFKHGQVVTRMSQSVGSPSLPEDEVVSTLKSWEGQADSSVSVEQLSGSEFKKRALQNGDTLLLYVGSRWMGSYRRLARLIAEKIDGIELFRIEPTEYLDSVTHFSEPDVEAPLLILYKDGEVAYRANGDFTASKESLIISRLSKHLTE